MELRDVELWRERACNGCLSRTDVKELVVGSEATKGSVLVIALCKECRVKLHKKLQEDCIGG